MEPIVLSWSGGKDSALALDVLRADSSVQVVALLTSVTSVIHTSGATGGAVSMGVLVHTVLVSAE